MKGVSQGAVWTAALVLTAAAGIGSYVGYSRASATPGGATDSEAYTTTTPLNAKKATAVNDGPPPPPPVDENYIRKIAHDEAMAIVHPAPKKVAVAQASDATDDSTDDTSDDSKTAGANPPTPPPAPNAPAAPVAATAPKPPPPPTGLY